MPMNVQHGKAEEQQDLPLSVSPWSSALPTQVSLAGAGTTHNVLLHWLWTSGVSLNINKK